MSRLRKRSCLIKLWRERPSQWLVVVRVSAFLSQIIIKAGKLTKVTAWIYRIVHSLKHLRDAQIKFGPIFQVEAARVLLAASVIGAYRGCC